MNTQFERNNRKQLHQRKHSHKIPCLLLVGSVAVMIALLYHLTPLKNYVGQSNIPPKQGTNVSYQSKENSNCKPLSRSQKEVKQALQALAKDYSDFESIYEHADSYPEELLSVLCNNPDMIDFAKGYLTADPSVVGTITKTELQQACPAFLQWDIRWGYAQYGDSCLGLSGCAPTCLSMVVVGLTKNDAATPAAIASYAENNGFYLPGTGTSWDLMTEGCKEYGITGEELPLEESAVMSALVKGHPIICSMRPGDFTTTGHFIVLAGVKDGKIVVNDPNSKIRSRKLWDYHVISPQIKNLWVYTK